MNMFTKNILLQIAIHEDAEQIRGFQNGQHRDLS